MVHVLISAQLPHSFCFIWVGANNPLVINFNEGLKWRPKVFLHLFWIGGEIFLVKLKVHWPNLCFRYLASLASYLKTSQISLAMMLNCVIEIFGHHNILFQCTLIPPLVAQPKMCPKCMLITCYLRLLKLF